MHSTLVLGELTDGSQKSHHLNLDTSNEEQSTKNEAVQRYLKLETVTVQDVFVQGYLPRIPFPV